MNWRNQSEEEEKKDTHYPVPSKVKVSKEAKEGNLELMEFYIIRMPQCHHVRYKKYRI